MIRIALFDARGREPRLIKVVPVDASDARLVRVYKQIAAEVAKAEGLTILSTNLAADRSKFDVVVTCSTPTVSLAKAPEPLSVALNGGREPSTPAMSKRHRDLHG
jgi:hypothetical protein